MITLVLFLLSLVAVGIWVTLSWGWLALAAYLFGLAVINFASSVLINLRSSDDETGANK
jgi:hypothetical protein